ncbi:MAG: ribosome recycling factor [Polaromonas sp.]|nr:ribosome recycling factor [Polaromonas sp.]
MSIVDVKQLAEQKMLQSIDSFKNGLTKIRTGRANPGLLDTVGMGAKIEKAIRDSDLGLNPAAQGDLIRVPMPAMTEERRKELTKVVRAEGEHAKVAIRNLRRDANDGIKKLVKDKLASEDDERRSQEDIQKFTDRFIAEVDKLVAGKEQDIMAV